MLQVALSADDRAMVMVAPGSLNEDYSVSIQQTTIFISGV